MRKYVIIALILLVVGIGASIYLIPSKSEVAGLQSTDAKAVDLGQVDVEAEYAQGRRTFPIISALADKRVAAGDRPAAIKLLEEYVAANASDVNGHKKLAEQYQLAGNQEGFYQQVELIAAAAPTEQNLRTLSDIYNANKEYVKQVEVLKKIVEVTKGNNPQAFVDLATIQVVVGDSDGALKTVEELKVKHPTFASYPMTRIMVSVLADKGRVDEAFAAAKTWVDSPVAAPVPSPSGTATTPPPAPGTAAVGAATNDSRPQELADLCNILHYSGHADKAIELVEPHIDMLDREPQLVLAYVNANITAGRADHAYNVLKKIDDEGRMVAALYPPYLDLTLKREDTAAAEGIANKLDVAGFNEEQALNTIEVARANSAPGVLKILTTRFNEPTYVNDKPVLNAVIAILTNDKAQDTKIETALNIQLTSTQRIRLAESCARASKTACFDAILKQYPPLEQMSPMQVAEYSQLFIIAERQKELVDPVGKLASVEHPAADVVIAHHRLAAAAGRHDVLKPWLAGNANTVPESQLQELFYLANDRKHTDVSSDIAERLYARDPSPMNRNIMVSAYIGAGSFDKALPLIREQMKEPGANDGLYLSTLSKVARRDAAARKELADYAQAALQADRGDDRQKLNYAYILINNGRKNEAIPYAKHYASQGNPEWKKLYANLTTKPKGGSGAPAAKLTREQMVAMANSKNISQSNKRQIAFNLLNAGHKNDAIVIFKDLAKDKGPDSQEVKDLMYLWGGKLNKEQLAWVQSRAANASPYDKQRWSDLINKGGDDNSVLAYVSATPDALYNRDLRKNYFRILASTGSRQNYEVAMRDWVAQTTDVPALLDYASTAQGSGYREAAVSGYQRVLALDPNNPKALSQLAALDYSKGKYQAADQNLNHYIATQQNNPDPESNPAQAHFYKAQLLRRQGNKAAANAEFAYVVQLASQTGASSPDALSRVYTSQFHIGQHRQAMQGFSQLLEQHPDDKGVLADYMSVLIEYNYLDEATRVANQYDKNSPYYQKGSALIGHSAHTASVQQFSDGREMKITFSQPIEGKPPIDLKKAQQLAWVESSDVGYDSVTISAKPGYVVRYIPTANEQFAVQAVPANEAYSPQVEAQRQQDLRLQLLYAQIEQNSGQPERARQRLQALQQYYPNDPQLVSYNAGLEASQGNTSQAIEMYQTAQMLSPENEDYARIVRDLRSGSRYGGAGAIAQYIKLDHEYRNYGANHEHITTLSGVARIGSRNELGFNLMNDEVSLKQIVAAAENETGAFEFGSDSRQAAELFFGHYLDDGSRVQGSIFLSSNVSGNNSVYDQTFSGQQIPLNGGDDITLGAGLYYAFNNTLGRSEVLGEYQKPYWDFPEAVYLRTTRDRIGVKHYSALNSGKTGLGFEASYNNYAVNLPDSFTFPAGVYSSPLTSTGRDIDTDAIAQTALIRFNVVQELQPMTDSQPYFGVSYGFDGEYLTDRADPEFTSAGSGLRVFPFRSRENHQISGIYRDDWTDSTHVMLLGGYLYDRLGDNGPVVEGRLNQDLSDRVEVGVRARYGLAATANGSASEDDAINLGAHVMYKF